MSGEDGYRVKRADWFEDYRVYAEDISRKTGVSKSQLDEVIELFMRHKILPDKLVNY